MAANMPIDYSALALFQRTLQAQQQQQQMFTDGVATYPKLIFMFQITPLPLQPSSQNK